MSDTNQDHDENNWHLKVVKKMHFVSGIQNARNILGDLERSLKKTSEYESMLIKCKSTHTHTHSHSVQTEWWAKDMSDDKESRSSKDRSTKISRSTVNLSESWSTMSIVCLQYQYEELSKRYESLLQAYDERCSAISKRDSSLQRMRALTSDAQAQIDDVHRSLLAVGDKYLSLKEKHHHHKHKYERKVCRLQEALARVVQFAERSRADLDAELTCRLAVETDTRRAALLAEIKRCNRLIIENLKLKQKVETISSSVDIADGNGSDE